MASSLSGLRRVIVVHMARQSSTSPRRRCSFASACSSSSRKRGREGWCVCVWRGRRGGCSCGRPSGGSSSATAPPAAVHLQRRLVRLAVPERVSVGLARLVVPGGRRSLVHLPCRHAQLCGSESRQACGRGGGRGARGHAPAAAKRSDSSDAAALAPPSRRASARMRACTACAICSAVSALTASPIFMCTLLQGREGGAVEWVEVHPIMVTKGSESMGECILTSARRGSCARSEA